MLVSRISSDLVYLVLLHICVHLTYSVPFIYVITIYVYVKLLHYVCFLNSQFFLAALVHFLCIFIGQFAFHFLFLFQNSESATFVAMLLVHASSGGRLFCMVVAVW